MFKIISTYQDHYTFSVCVLRTPISVLENSTGCPILPISSKLYSTHRMNTIILIISKRFHAICLYVVPPQSWGDRSDTKHSKCLLLGGRWLNQLTLIPKPKGSGGARAATAQVGPANNRNDTKRCLPIEASLRPGEAVPW